MVRLFAFILTGLALFGGCRTPLRAITEADVTVQNSAVTDYGPLAEHYVISAHEDTCEKIALIDVDGILLNAPVTGLGSLGENPVSIFREKLDQVAATPGYRAVVLRINSPGGGVTASDIMWRDLQTFKSQTGLPVVACLLDMGTGGAYYLALGADHIMAHPTTVLGGIGVILNLYNLEETMLQFNILGAPVKSGRHIDLGTPLVAADDEAREILQGIGDRYHSRFRDMVLKHRGEASGSHSDCFDGRVFMPTEALEGQLIDSIGYLDDAIHLARQMGAAPTAGVVMLHRQGDPARSPYAASPHTPLQGGILPIGIPGLERTLLPTFLYMWQPEPSYERRAQGR